MKARVRFDVKIKYKLGLVLVFHLGLFLPLGVKL